MTATWGTNTLDDNTEHIIIAAPTATSGQHLHITALVLSNLTATANNVTIRDGASGSTIMVFVFAAAVGDKIVHFAGPGLRLTAEYALAAISSAVGPSVQVTAVGYVDRV